jgi:hypothetical protein
MKLWIATYIDPATGKDLDPSRLRLHEAHCRVLQPSSSRPHVGRRRATSSELASHAKCKLC